MLYNTGILLFYILGTFIIGLLVFAGSVASSALFSASLAGIYIDLIIVILCRLFGGVEWVPGPITMGRFVRI